RALRRAPGAMEVLAGCRDRRADDANPPIPVRGVGRAGAAPGAHPQSPERAAPGPDRVVAHRSRRSPGNGYENATWTGLSRRWRAPPSVWSPSCPAASQPQHHIDPVLFTAQVWRLPAVIRTTPESLPLPYTTWTGFRRRWFEFPRVPSPSWPYESRPQHQADPVLLAAQVC